MPAKSSKKTSPKAQKTEPPELPVKTGRIQVDVQPDNYRQKLPLDLGRGPEGALLVDLRKGLTCLLVLPGDKVVRVTIAPEDLVPVTEAPTSPVVGAPVEDPIDKLLENL